MFNRFACLFAACALSFAADSTAAQYDLIIQNARIIDGTGAPWFRGSVAVSGDRVAAIGILDTEATAPLVIDAGEQYVAPGFIDVHTHSEGDLDDLPRAENFLRMGVTTLVTGNCGGSYRDIGAAFTSHSLQKFAPNFATLIGHNTVRRAVMENAARDPSTTELEAMKLLVDQGMRDGAIGLSTGLIYTPGLYSKTPEVIELAKAASAHNGIYVSHMRSEGLNVVKAIDEALTIGLQAKCPVQLSHFKITSPRLWGMSTQTIQMVKDAREAGIDVTVDQYVYTASSTGINTMLPDHVVEGSTSEIRSRLLDPAKRATILAEMLESYRNSGRKDFSYARVASFREDPSINGKSILEIAKLWKNDESLEAQGETILDIVTSGGASMVFYSMAEEDVQNILRFPHSMVASDSGVRRFGVSVPHPRGYGNNARVLGRYVRDLKVISLEEAVRKMSSLPARSMRFQDRGVLRPGMAADIVMFDLAKVNDPATFEKPHAYAEGFSHVVINGKPVIMNGEFTEEYPGKLLRGPGYQPVAATVPAETTATATIAAAH